MTRNAQAARGREYLGVPDAAGEKRGHPATPWPSRCHSASAGREGKDGNAQVEDLGVSEAAGEIEDTLPRPGQADVIRSQQDGRGRTHTDNYGAQRVSEQIHLPAAQRRCRCLLVGVSWTGLAPLLRTPRSVCKGDQQRREEILLWGLTGSGRERNRPPRAALAHSRCAELNRYCMKGVQQNGARGGEGTGAIHSCLGGRIQHQTSIAPESSSLMGT